MTTAADHDSHSLSPLRRALGACRGGFIAVVVFSLGVNLLMLTAPLYMMQVFDRVLSSRSMDTLVMLLLLATVALAVMGLLDAVRSLLLVRMSAWLDGHLSGVVLSESVLAHVRRGRAPSIGGLRDLGNLRGFLTGPGIFPVLDAPWAPVFILVVFLLHPWLGVLSLVGAMALFALAVANEAAVHTPLKRAGGASSLAYADAEATMRNADAVEAMGMMPNMVRRWHKRNGESVALQSRASNKSAMLVAASKFLRMLLQIGVLSLGAWLVIDGQLTAGGMIAGSILMARALAPVEQAIGTWKSASQARESYGRLTELLSDPAVDGSAMPLPAPRGEVTAEQVTFAFPRARSPLFRNVSFRLQPGESVGVIGPTAAGKTTLGRLLIGNLKPDGGHVRLDGMDVAEWDRADLGQYIGYLPQDVELFSGTIRENIARMGEGDADAVVDAAEMAGVHQMILGLPRGYETEIGPGGAALSGGQRQRIGLARALYGHPRLVLLDEPNASLDNAGETALLRALQSLKAASVTVVVIAHRPAVVANLDKLLVLRGGGLQMFGPRESVLSRLRDGRRIAQRPAPGRNGSDDSEEDGAGNDAGEDTEAGGGAS